VTTSLFKKLWFFSLLSIFCYPSIASQAADTPSINKHKIYAYMLKDRLGKQENLPYNKLLKYVSQDLGDLVEVLPAPLPRSAQNFLQDNNSCIFPTSSAALQRVHSEKLAGRLLLNSEPVDFVSIRLYTSKSDPVITDKAQLKGKVIGHLLGSVGSLLLNTEGVTIKNVRDESLLLKMLARKRIDVLMGHHPDIPMAIERLQVDDLHFDPDLMVFSTAVHLVCHPFAGSQVILAAINKRIKEIRANGMAQQMLGKYAKIVPLPATAKSGSAANSTE